MTINITLGDRIAFAERLPQNGNLKMMADVKRIKNILVGFAIGFLSFVLAVVGAFYKEIKDARSGGYFDKADILATLLGGVFGQFLSIILWWIIKTKLA